MYDRKAIRLAACETVRDMTGADVAVDTPLISSGLIDSLSILELIAALEERLKVSISPAHLQPDDFESIEWIVDTVERAAIPQ